MKNDKVHNMKFNKLFIVILAVLLCICSLCIGTVAHSGRTDSKGGHHDRSDGSYHYHHGYSAHDHYDIDGDGKKDCPYNFNDKTDHDSNSGNSTSTYTKDDLEIITFGDVLIAMLKAFVLAAVLAFSVGLLVYYILVSIWVLIFGERGFLVFNILLIILFGIFYIWLVIQFV